MKILNRNQVKYLAIVAMLIDHIAWMMFPTSTVTGQILHFFGRITGPMMAIMVAEGYEHTRDVKKYAMRLFVFALISWAPFSLFETGVWPSYMFGVIYTLFLSLIAIIVWDRTKLPVAVKVLIVIGLCLLSFYGDWPVFDVLWALLFFVHRNDFKKKWISFSIVSGFMAGVSVVHRLNSPCPWEGFFQCGVFLVPLIYIFLYNGEPGSRHPFHKWFFYVFYPLHLIILWLIFR